MPFVFGGNPAVVVSENNGATWTLRRVPNAASSAGVDDPSVGVSWCPPGTCSPAEKAARSNHIYMGFMYADGRPGIAYSSDKGVNWQRVVDLGALTDIKHIAFPAVAVGDPDRATFAFFGTTTQGDYATAEFPGVWYLYVATTFDYGQTWTVQNVTPNDPIQRGGICGDGTCRNLLDFIDIQLDKQGRVLIAGEDGCIGGCVNGGANSFTAKAFISRQSGGKRMFSIYDAQNVEPALCRERLRFRRAINATQNAIALSWPEPDNGGTAVVGYKVFRSASQVGPFNDGSANCHGHAARLCRHQLPERQQFLCCDRRECDGGEPPYCKEVQAVTGGVTACELPGYHRQ